MPPARPSDDLLRDLVEPVCLAHGLELVDVRVVTERGRRVVRILIDREGAGDGDAIGSGVTLADCTAVSRDAGAALDLHEEAISGPYSLEVSSPGVERPLLRPADWTRFVGREARVATRRPIGERRRFHGVIRGLDGAEVQLEQDGAEVRIPLQEITKANLVYRF